MTVLIPGLYGLDSATAWRALSKDPQKYIDRVAADKNVKKEIDYFDKVAPKFKTVDDLIKDRRALQYVLNAYGLGSEINNAGRIKRVLSEDPFKTSSLVNKLSETKFKTMATSLRLDQGFATLQRLSFRDGIEEKYIQNEFEVSLGSQDNALRQAVYFARNTSSIKDVYSVLGDSILRDVVQSTYNLPAQLAIQPVETQASEISKRIDVKKFSSSITGTVSTTALTNATADYTAIGNKLAVSDAARAQVKIVQDQLTQLSTDYANLDTITDPVGANASTITLQQTAVPQLVRFEQLVRGGTKAIGSVESNVQGLLDLVTQAGDPNNTLSLLKTQFDSLVASLNTSIASADVTVPDGTTQNILQNGANDTTSTTVDSAGNSVTINRYDTTNLQTLINDAKTAFNSLTSSSDEDILVQVQSKLLNSQDQISAIRTTLSTDLTALQTTTGETLFAATLNSDALVTGKQSIDDGLARIQSVEELLTKIGALAKTAKGLVDGADRTDLNTQFADYKTQIRNLLNTPGTGLDNLLNGSGNSSYEIIAGQNYTVKNSYNLLTSIADVLDANNLDTVTAATDLETATIQVTTSSDKQKASLNADKLIVDRIALTYDPRAKLDLQIYDLQSKISDIVAAAAKDGANLLSADQSDIKLTGLSTGTSLTFSAQSSFLSTVQTGLNDIVAQLGNSTSSIRSAVVSLSTTVDRTKFNLDIENRRATLEYGRLGGTIDAINAKNASSSTASSTNPYKVNEFTQKFITRYLTLNAQNSGTITGGNSFLIGLFGGSSDSSSAISSIQALSIKV